MPRASSSTTTTAARTPNLRRSARLAPYNLRDLQPPPPTVTLHLPTVQAANQPNQGRRNPNVITIESEDEGAGTSRSRIRGPADSLEDILRLSTRIHPGVNPMRGNTQRQANGSSAQRRHRRASRHQMRNVQIFSNPSAHIYDRNLEEEHALFHRHLPFMARFDYTFLNPFPLKPPAPTKYTVSVSHPDPIPPGFSKDIISVEEEESAKTSKRSRRNMMHGVIPVCASCLFPLYLEDPDSSVKNWVLKCGHAVCGRCLQSAKLRCEEVKNAGVGWLPISFKSKASGTGKGKEKEIDDPDGVDENWTVCPCNLQGCQGGTDLLASKDSEDGPWELFV